MSCDTPCECRARNLPPNAWCDRWSRFVPPLHRDACACDPGLSPARAEGYRNFMAQHPLPKPADGPKLPSLLAQAVSYARSTARHAASGFHETTPAEKDRRLAICHACPHLNRSKPEMPRCGICGCPVEAKTARATESCPEKTPGGPKWLPELVTHRNSLVPFPDERDIRYDSGDIAGIDSIAEAPTFYDAHGVPASHAFLGGRTALLIGGGPSLDLAALDGLPPEVVTMGMNNVGQILRTDFWTCIDPAVRFPEGTWLDPEVRKVVPRAMAAQVLPSGREVASMSNVAYFVRNYRFRSATYLSEPTFTVGNEEGQADELGVVGTRSVMLAAIKALCAMQCRKIVILGADFRMEPSRPYAHGEAKTESECRHANVAFAHTNLRLQALRPRLEMAGIRVINATPVGGLTAFERMPLEQALRA